MSNPRRHILRFPGNGPTPNPRRQAQDQKIRARLATEKASLVRWMSRLRRAFHTVEKLQSRIARLERQLSPEEE